MLTGAAIEVSSTPLPRAVPLTPGAAGRGGGPGNNMSAASSSDVEEKHRSSWQQQQKFAVAAAAEKKDITPVYAYQPDEPAVSPKSAATARTVGVERGGSGDNNNSNTCWSDKKRTVPEGSAGTSSTAAPTSAERSWRASYASSLYCLLPAWLLRFRGPAYSPLRDDACGSGASSTRAASSSCGTNTAGTAGGSVATGGGGGGQETNSFGDAPFSTVCLHCHKAIITTVTFKISCLGICFCLLSPLLLGWPGLCLSPFIYIALKDAVHTCPQCRNLIHRQSRISVPFFGLRDEVVTVKCGNCAVVLSRRYLLLFAALLLFILLFYILRAGWLGSSLDVISKGPPANMSWKQFYEQCGQRSQLGNSLKAGANFRESFAGKTVEWKGLVKQVKEGFFSSNVLLVVMYPTITLAGGGGQSSSAGEGESSGRSSEDESPNTSNSKEKADYFAEKKDAATEGRITGQKDDDSSSSTSEQGDDNNLEEEAKAMQGDGADLALAFTGSELIKKIEKLEPGDRIEFEATLVALGRRGKPSLGRLWSVSLIEKREVREMRLEEWRAKKAERQHLLQRLLVPLMGSPFSDFGFDPISSLFSSTGGMGGTGVMVIRRQIISPGATFSMISSSSDDEPSMGLPSIFEGTRSISVDGIRRRGHEDEDEKHRTGKDAGKYGDAGENLLFHVNDEDDDNLKESVTAGLKFGHRQQPENKARSHPMPSWSENSGNEEEARRWTGGRHAGSGGSGLYFHIHDDEEEEPSAVVDGGPEAGGTASTGLGGAGIRYEKNVKPQQSHEGAPGGEDAGAGDPTLAALKLAVERQRQRRAEQAEQSKQQGQQQAHQGTQKQPQHGQPRPPVPKQHQAYNGEDEAGGTSTSPGVYTAPSAANVGNGTPSPQVPSHMQGGGYATHPGDTSRETESAHTTHSPSTIDSQHGEEQRDTQTEDMHSTQGPMAH